MSAKNRGPKRGGAADYYPTPAWVTHALLDNVALPGGRWLEPCAGDGAIIRAVNERRTLHGWDAVDVGIDGGDAGGARVDNWLCGVDFTAVHPRELGPLDLVITNPPYSIAADIIRHAFQFAPVVVMLLRLNFLGSSRKRLDLLPSESHGMPDVYVLSKRPSFTGDGRTDASEYAWFVWGMGGGRIRVI